MITSHGSLTLITACDRLSQAELDKLKGGIWIIPEPKYEYARIRISYLLLSVELFGAIDIIARYVKSGW